MSCYYKVIAVIIATASVSSQCNKLFSMPLLYKNVKLQFRSYVWYSAQSIEIMIAIIAGCNNSETDVIFYSFNETAVGRTVANVSALYTAANIKFPIHCK